MVVDPRKLSFLGAGIAAALLAAPHALADPAPPVPPPPSPPAAGAPVAAAAGAPSPPAAGAPVVAAAASAPAPGNSAPAPAQTPPAPPAQGVSHLASPDALPPGTTMDPSVRANERPNVNYLKDLWHAVQSQEISGKEALIMGLAQRRLTSPYPEQAPGPNVPLSPAQPAAAPPSPPPAPPAAAPAPAAAAPAPAAAGPAAAAPAP